MNQKEFEILIKRVEKLESVVFSKPTPSKSIPQNDLNYDLNERAFVKRYSHNKSGPQKLVLLVAYLSKGKIGQIVNLTDIINLWNKMTSKDLLKYKFNRYYPTVAKGNGWINSNKSGTYELAADWLDSTKDVK